MEERMSTRAGGISMTAMGAGILFSLMAGFVLGILFAPQSGAETRRQIAYRAQDMKDRTAQVFNKTRSMFMRKKDEVGASMTE